MKPIETGKFGEIDNLLTPADFKYLEDKYCNECMHRDYFINRKPPKLSHPCRLHGFILTWSCCKEFTDETETKIRNCDLLYKLRDAKIVEFDPIQCNMFIRVGSFIGSNSIIQDVTCNEEFKGNGEEINVRETE